METIYDNERVADYKEYIEFLKEENLKNYKQAVSNQISVIKDEVVKQGYNPEKIKFHEIISMGGIGITSTIVGIETETETGNSFSNHNLRYEFSYLLIRYEHNSVTGVQWTEWNKSAQEKVNQIRKLIIPRIKIRELEEKVQTLTEELQAKELD